MLKSLFVICVVVLSGLNSCVNEGESATRGSIGVAVDESFSQILEAEKTAFTSTYPEVNIKNTYVSEGTAVNLLLADSVRLIAISRELDSTEKMVLYKQRKNEARSYHIATDAVCLITNTENPDSAVTFEQLQDILNGKARTWSQAFKNGISDSMVVVFDKSNSSNLAFLRTKLGINQEKIPVFAAGSNEKVVEYVRNKKGALGVIGMSWISDKDSPLAIAIRKKIRIMWVADRGADEYFLPYQSELMNKIDTVHKKLYQNYPLARKIYLVNREPGTGPATGFMNYIGSDVGQRIILKFGILPSKMPQRLIQIR